jgi:hypothetical protein
LVDDPIEDDVSADVGIEHEALTDQEEGVGKLHRLRIEDVGEQHLRIDRLGGVVPRIQLGAETRLRPGVEQSVGVIEIESRRWPHRVAE